MPNPITPETIIALRRRLGETQATFAVRLGVSQAAVNRWERGLRFPDGRSVVKLIDLMASPKADIIDTTGSPAARQRSGHAESS